MGLGTSGFASAVEFLGSGLGVGTFYNPYYRPLAWTPVLEPFFTEYILCTLPSEVPTSNSKLGRVLST